MRRQASTGVRVVIALLFVVQATMLAGGCSSDPSGQQDAAATTPTDSAAADASDAFVPSDDPDAECVCRADGWSGRMPSLRCFCGGECPTFEQLLGRCTPFGDPSFNEVVEHAACNLVKITFGGGFGGSIYVFDGTTHALVGASNGDDSPTVDCGTSKVFGISAGTFPPSDCPISARRPRCPVDLDASRPSFDAGRDAPPNVSPSVD